MLDAANDKPWLWAVYVLCVLIPVILLGVCCFGKKSTPMPKKKQYDSFRDDDRAPNLVEDEGEEVVHEEEPPKRRESTEQKKKSNPPSPVVEKKTSQAMQDIEVRTVSLSQ